MEITERPVKDLLPYSQNARTHSDAQVAQIVASIEEFGWTNPVLVDGQNGVIAGHGRLLAALKMGRDTVPCIEHDHMTAEQQRAYIIADNRLAENAGWDKELLALELGELGAGDFDLSVIGFDSSELDGLLAFVPGTEGLTEPDAIVEPETEAVTALGDIWLLGRHRIQCGDATDRQGVKRLLAGEEPHLMVTDPPYGVEYDASWRPRLNKIKPGFSTGIHAEGKVKNDNTADWRKAWRLFRGDVAYVWHAGNKAHISAGSLEATGFTIRAQIIWAKSNMVIGRGDYHPKHEACWYAVRKGKTGHYVGGRKQTTVWDIDKPMKSETGHSTQKPVECMQRPMENNSASGDLVYDPFLGSGTTVIAAERTGRACLAIELDPLYVDVAVRRWQNFTGEIAVHEGSGETFTQVAANRQEAA